MLVPFGVPTMPVRLCLGLPDAASGVMLRLQMFAIYLTLFVFLLSVSPWLHIFIEKACFGDEVKAGETLKGDTIVIKAIIRVAAILRITGIVANGDVVLTLS